jgi:hypothetical protein
MALAGKPAPQVLLELETAVVGANGDAHGRQRLTQGRGGVKDRAQPSVLARTRELSCWQRADTIDDVTECAR